MHASKPSTPGSFTRPDRKRHISTDEDRRPMGDTHDGLVAFVSGDGGQRWLAVPTRP